MLTAVHTGWIAGKVVRSVQVVLKLAWEVTVGWGGLVGAGQSWDRARESERRNDEGGCYMVVVEVLVEITVVKDGLRWCDIQLGAQLRCKHA